MAATVGLLDLPAEQRTTPLALDFAGAAGHLAIVGAPQTGKSTFLKGLVTALAREHTPDEVRLYCIDLGGGALAELEAAPHVGGVATKLDRERVRQSVRHVQGLLEERELAFRRLGLASMADARARRARGELEEELPDVFLVVDNWAALKRDFEGLDQEVEQLANGGLNYGVHLLLSANRWAEIRPHLRDNVGSRLELRLNDPIDSEHGRRVADVAAGRHARPRARPGRAPLPGGDARRGGRPRVGRALGRRARAARADAAAAGGAVGAAGAGRGRCGRRADRPRRAAARAGPSRPGRAATRTSSCWATPSRASPTSCAGSRARSRRARTPAGRRC